MGQQRKRWFLTGIFKLNPKVHRERGTDESALWLLLASDNAEAVCQLLGDEALAKVPVTALIPATHAEVSAHTCNLVERPINQHLKPRLLAKAAHLTSLS